jgi:hypothetical protein
MGAGLYWYTGPHPHDHRHTEWEHAQVEVASLIEVFGYEAALSKTQKLYGQRFGTEFPGYFNGYFDEAGTEFIEDPKRATEALVPGKLAEIRRRIEKRDRFIQAVFNETRDELRKPLDDRARQRLIDVVKDRVLGDPEKAARPGVVKEVAALEREIMRTGSVD